MLSYHMENDEEGGVPKMKKMALLLCAVLFICTCTACSMEKETISVAYDLSASPKNIDPQNASTQDAAILLRHIMQGLYHIDSDGNVQKALAGDTSVSEDGKTYTVTIREDAQWFYLDEEKNEQYAPVTAQDFVFAFRRLLRPDTGSAAASRFFCIENAEAVNSGTLSEESLGVFAQDDRTVVFRLQSANDYFLNLLATTYAMPCNESFFEETRGRYGLNKDTILSNGAYRISSWDDSSQIRLVKNSAYYDADKVSADQIRLRITTDKETRLDIDRLKEGTVDAMLLSGEAASALPEEEYQTAWIESGTWGILLNTKKDALANVKIRRGIAQCFDRSAYEPILPSYLKTADTLVPDSAAMFDIAYAADGHTLGVSVDIPSGEALYSQGLSEIGRSAINGMTLLINKDAEQDVTPYFLQVSQLLQRDLSLYISVETVSASEYRSRIASGDYDMAAVYYTAADNSAISYLTPFVSDSSENTSGYQNAQVDSLLSDVSSARTVQEAVSKCRSAEQQILSDGVFLPLFYQTDAFVMRRDTSGIFYDCNTGTVMLSGVQFS